MRSLKNFAHAIRLSSNQTSAPSNKLRAADQPASDVVSLISCASQMADGASAGIKKTRPVVKSDQYPGLPPKTSVSPGAQRNALGRGLVRVTCKLNLPAASQAGHSKSEAVS